MNKTAILVEGLVIGLIVILDGIYVVGAPPYGDEMQGYGIAMIGIFIILISYHISRNSGN